MTGLQNFLTAAYPWTKAFHIIAMVAWMAGLFYLPRLFVYHAEVASAPGETSEMLKTMERRLLRAIMNPAMIATWILGLLMAAMGGLDLGASAWGWVKLAGVLGLTAFHGWCAARTREFGEGRNTRAGRTYRIANEVPTLLLVGGDDKAIAPETAFALKDRLPQARVRLIRNLGHLAHEEDPARIADAIIAAYGEQIAAGHPSAGA